jgi:predicted TIM-barrel fold metal-dependent hydrolase
VTAAVAEIERWADHPGMVQVGVPLQSREPYGKPQFLPIWKAAAEHGLPVAVRVTGGAGLEFPPTPTGHARTYPHYVGMFPLNFFVHLSNLIIEGVFEKVPDLTFVFADGGSDVLTPLMWRLDTLWFALRAQTPWVTDYPSTYLKGHVRLCTRNIEGPTDEVASGWYAQDGKEDLVMYGSHYPFWYWAKPDEIPATLTADQREKLLYANADKLYRLNVCAGIETTANSEGDAS